MRRKTRTPRTPVAAREQGFVLIAALWLLLLSGALVAVMMLKSGRGSAVAKTRAVEVQSRFDADAAVDTIMADILFRGGGSRWARLPANGSVALGTHDVDVAITSESGRLDLNSADTGLIGRALQGTVSSVDRARFLAAVQQARQGTGSLDSLAQASPLLSLLPADHCVSDWFTVYSGMPGVDTGAAPAGLSRALGAPQIEASDAVIRPGLVMRLELRPVGGSPVMIVARIVGRPDHAYDTLFWTNEAPCQL